jgi:hypothetical protein
MYLNVLCLMSYVLCLTSCVIYLMSYVFRCKSCSGFDLRTCPRGAYVTAIENSRNYLNLCEMEVMGVAAKEAGGFLPIVILVIWKYEELYAFLSGWWEWCFVIKPQAYAFGVITKHHFHQPDKNPYQLRVPSDNGFISTVHKFLTRKKKS